MSRATISTGNFSLDASADKKASNDWGSIEKSSHCHIVCVADFSGRGHRGLNDAASIKSRKVIEVDRDNFDDVFEQIDVRCALPIAEEVRFSELDDMHPDYLYEHIDLFSKFKSLKKKLKNASTFASAAQEIYAWQNVSEKTERELSSASTSDAASEGSLLDNILSGGQHDASSNGTDFQALIKDIVAPYITPKPDPQQKELIHAVDLAASELMRKLMHHPQFQTLESAWRSLYLLVRRIETNSKLKLFIVDVSEQELVEDSNSSDRAEETQLHKLLVDNRLSTGSKPFNIIMADGIFGEHENDIQTLSHLGEVALSGKALLISGASTRLVGCENLSVTPDHDDWCFSQDLNVQTAWQSLRESAQAHHIIAVAPRYLSRMPYGKKSAPIDSFRFEELPSHNKHEFYLWSNGAWLVTLLLAQGFQQGGNITTQYIQEVERLPLHVFFEDDESKVTPCAEVNMLDSAASLLQRVGLTVVRTILNKDSVLVPQIKTLAN